MAVCAGRGRCFFTGSFVNIADGCYNRKQHWFAGFAKLIDGEASRLKKDGFQKLMTGFDCLVLDDTAFGAQEGYPYSVQLAQSGETSDFFFRFVVDGDVRPVAKALKAERMPHIKWYAEKDAAVGGVLVAWAKPPSDFYNKGDISNVLQAVVPALSGAGLSRHQKCPLCGNGNCDVYAWLDEGYRATHSSCLQSRLDLPPEDEVTPVTTRGNYFTGILGAFIGAFIGMLPNFAQAFSKLSISAPLYAFIPILSTLVYRLFRGKASRVFSSVVVLLASLAATFALELVWFWLSKAETSGYTVSFAETTALYFSAHTIFISLQEMWICLAFLAVGFVPSGIILRRNAKSGTIGGENIRGSKYVQESATPVNRPKKEAEPPRRSSEPQEDYVYYI